MNSTRNKEIQMLYDAIKEIALFSKKISKNLP
jgi:hypothetical protein